LAYSPLASGYLSGKYRNNQIPKNSRIEEILIFGQDMQSLILKKQLMLIMK